MNHLQIKPLNVDQYRNKYNIKMTKQVYSLVNSPGILFSHYDKVMR